MNKPHGIIVFGPNGSGKTTLGRELARILGFLHMDHEAYHFAPSDIPYTAERPRAECLRLMRADIEKHRAFVLSAVTGDFGDTIPRLYELGVYLTAPLALRMQRIAQREQGRHGDRLLKGGDMQAQHRRFLDFAAARPLSKIDQWAQTLPCPVVRIDGAQDFRTNAAAIAARFYDETGRMKPTARP